MSNHIDGNTSDGYHTFNELYEFRKAYNIALFNEWALNGKHHVHKSWKHEDGELCFGGGWFIVVAVLPQGQISNHYKAEDWDLFKIKEADKAIFKFDGHTGDDVIKRLKSYTPSQLEKQEPETIETPMKLTCTKCGAVDEGTLVIETPQLRAVLDEVNAKLKGKNK
jgi:hypothetical protein